MPVGITLLFANALAGAGPNAAPVIGSCPVFPSDNIRNTRVDTLPVDPRPDHYVAGIGADANLKADFGAGLHEGAPIGILYVVVPANQAIVPIHHAPFGGEIADLTTALGPAAQQFSFWH